VRLVSGPGRHAANHEGGKPAITLALGARHGLDYAQKNGGLGYTDTSGDVLQQDMETVSFTRRSGQTRQTALAR
jgi:hypothetical protein